MSNYLTRFLPSVHGFRFGNHFRHQVIGPVSTWGWCSGICQVSLDFFHAGRAAPTIDVVDFGLRPASGIAAASWSADRVDLFVRRDDDRVATKHLEGGRFGDWHDLTSGQSALSPAAASWGPGRLDVVVPGSDGKLRHQWYDNGWAGAGGVCRPLPDYVENLGGVLGSSPAIAAPTANRLATYTRGADGSLWFKHYDGTWRDWQSLGRPDGITLTSDPAATGHSGWMTVLVRGSDDAIWQREWAESRWQSWQSIGGTATSAPAVASPSPGRTEAYVRGADGNMYLNIAVHRRWQGWKSIGAPPPGLSTERPAAISHTAVMDVYALANDQTVWHKRWSNGWQPWQSAETAIGITSRRLTDSIYRRMMACTIAPLQAAIPLGPAALLLAGTAARFVQFHTVADDTLFQRANTDEMVKLTKFLQTGSPISIGLLSPDARGHEVVVRGADVNPGNRSTLRVYDPNYPGCDEATIVIDPTTRTIRSGSGETWRSLWVRDDIGYEPPLI